MEPVYSKIDGADPSHRKYRPDIDGLRSVAVLSVVVFHAFPGKLSGGFIGVDIFFVISGFLISKIIFQDLEIRNFRFFDFYARRIKRIFPALLLVLASSLVFGWFALLTDEYQELSKHTVAGLGFFSNFLLWAEAGYFDGPAENKPLLHLWSLGIEEQFYLCWPLICWGLWYLRRGRLIWIIIIGAVSLTFNLVISSADQVSAFYSPLTRIWELIFGGLIAYLNVYKRDYFRGIRSSKCISNSISLSGFALLVLGFILIDKDRVFPGFWAFIPVAGSVLIISAGGAAWPNRAFLGSRPMIFIGLISYPLYLWHWPILTFLKIVERDTPDKYARLGAIAISFVLAWLTFQFLERRVRASRSNVVLVQLIGTAMVTLLVSLFIYNQGGVPSRDAVVESEFSEEVRYQFMGSQWPYTQNDQCLRDHSFSGQSELPWWFCMKSSSRPATILLLGNSYANQLYPGFSKNPALSHHSVLSIGTCGVGILGSDVAVGHACYGTRVEEQDRFINEVISQSSSLEVVIIDGLRRRPSVEYIERVLDRVSFLESKGLQVVVFVPHLRPNFNPKACFKSPLRREKKDCEVPSVERRELLAEFSPLIDSLRESDSKALVFDQNDVFCDLEGGHCSYVKNGLPLYRDEDHISEHASIEIQTYFTEWAKAFLPMMFQATVDN